MHYDREKVKAWAGDSQWRAWRADRARLRARGVNPCASGGFWALTIYRAQRAIQRSRHRRLWLPLSVVLGLWKHAVVLLTHISLNPEAEIGAGFLIPHLGQIRVTRGAKIGVDCSVLPVVTIGRTSKPAAPVIGDHVYIGCHACVLGPVHVGDGAKIGAGAVVVTDIPAGATAVGVPARVISPGDILHQAMFDTEPVEHAQVPARLQSAGRADSQGEHEPHRDRLAS